MGREPPCEVNWHEAVKQLTGTVALLDKRVEAAEDNVVALQQRLNNNQERICVRLEEVVGSVSGFGNIISGCREEVQESKRGVEQCWAAIGSQSDRETAGGAAVTEMVSEMERLQNEFTLLQKHIMNVFNKLCSDVGVVDGIARESQERTERLEAQVRGLHCGLQETANDVILLKQGSPPGPRQMLLQSCPGAEEPPQAVATIAPLSAKRVGVPEIRGYSATSTSTRSGALEPMVSPVRSPPVPGLDAAATLSGRRHYWGTGSPPAPSPMQQPEALASAMPSAMAACVMGGRLSPRVHVAVTGHLIQTT